MSSVGRRWAYGGAILGAAVSIAANIAHSYVPPADVGTDWAPQPGAVALAIFWPVALLVGIEILARVLWPAGWKWWLARWLGLVPVAAVAAVVSYRHLSGLLAFYGEDALTVAIGPLAVDGLMVMATGALLAPARVVQQRAPGPVPALTTVLGLVDDAHRAAAAAAARPAVVTIPVPARPPAGQPAPEELLALGRRVHASLDRPTYAAFAAQVREAGGRAGTGRLKQLYAQVRQPASRSQP